MQIAGLTGKATDLDKGWRRLVQVGLRPDALLHRLSKLNQKHVETYRI